MICPTDLAEGTSGTMDCCAQHLHTDCQAQWISSCLRGAAENAQQDDLSLLVPETPCCAFCRATCGTSTRARSSMWG